MTATLTQRTADAAAVALKNAETSEHQRRLTDEVIRALKNVDVLRAYVPVAYGGPEYSPFETMSIIETLSAADGSTGWCATIASLTSHIAGCLPAEAAKEIFDPADAAVCGAYAPSGRGTARGDGSYDVTGHWAWGSGSSFATWMTGGAVNDDGTARHMFFRSSDLTMHDTWDSNGLRATASHDFSVYEVHVPAGHSVDLAAARPTVEAAISRMPLFVLFSGGVASVMLGIATRAMEELAILAQTKKPVQSSKTLAQSSLAQVDIARAEAAIRSARAFLHESVGEAWERVQQGDRVGLETRLRARLAATHAGEQACAAVDLCYKAGGGSAVYATSPLQRCFRDVHTASAHVMVGSRVYETIGRHRFGLEIDKSSL